MITIHHLNMSRSERIVWLAEELGLRYELINHQRDPQTFRAPPSLWAVSPFGKAPIIQDDGKTIYESGAIVEYLLERHGHGKLKPKPDSDEYIGYLHWMHAAEATLMMPIMMDLLGKMLQVDVPAYKMFRDGEYKTTLLFLDTTLAKSPYVAGQNFTGADVMVTYDLHLANGTSFPALKSTAPLDDYPNIVAYLRRVEARPAYLKMRKLCA